MKVNVLQPNITARSVKSVVPSISAISTAVVVLFYTFNIIDIIKLLAGFLNLESVTHVVEKLLKAINYESVATSLGFNGGLMPFLSWRNFRLYSLSLLLSILILAIVRCLVPRKGLKSEPLCWSGEHSLQYYNINTKKFQNLYRTYTEHEIIRMLDGFPKNIAEAILHASSEVIEQDHKLDTKKTVLRCRIKAVLRIHENLEKTTGRVLNYVANISKLLLIAVAIGVFAGFLEKQQLSNNVYYSQLFLTSYFLIKIINGLSKNAQYGLCKDKIPKHFLKKFIKSHSTPSKIKSAILLSPFVGLYNAKEQAILDIYSTKSINVALEEIDIDDIRDAIESGMNISV